MRIFLIDLLNHNIVKIVHKIKNINYIYTCHFANNFATTSAKEIDIVVKDSVTANSIEIVNEYPKFYTTPFYANRRLKDVIFANLYEANKQDYFVLVIAFYFTNRLFKPVVWCVAIFVVDLNYDVLFFIIFTTQKGHCAANYNVCRFFGSSHWVGFRANRQMIFFFLVAFFVTFGL